VQEDGAPATAIDVLANDTDGDGGSKTIQSVTQPTNGAVVITDSVSGLTYEPNADYCNDPPATNLDTFTYTLNDNLAVVASSLSDPANGTVSLITSGTNTGKVLYKPDQNYNNTAATRDTFTYKVNDGQANSNNAATVSVKVDPVNDVPTVAVAAGGSCATNDRSGTINLTVRDPDGQAQTASLKLSATSNNTLTGTSATATLSGTDILLGQNGDDSLSGVGGKDLLCGGRGNDRLSGGDDADRFEGGSGTDTATDFTASQGDSRVGIP
jgi:Ca2+-binding RTX toxin-like protein